MSDDSLYAVLNVSDTEPNLLVLAEVYSEVLQIPRADAQFDAKRNGYVFGLSDSKSDAEKFSGALSAAGIESIIVPGTCFTPFGPPKRINNADCLPDRFEVQAEGSTLPIQWPEVAMISYGCIEYRPRPRIAPVIDDEDDIDPSMVRPARTVPQTPSPGKLEMIDCVDIFTGSMSAFIERFRVISGKFCYDYLGADKRPASAVNFKRFMSDLVQYATGAVLTERTRRFLIGDRRPLHGFEAFDNYHMWSIFMARKGTEK